MPRSGGDLVVVALAAIVLAAIAAAVVLRLDDSTADLAPLATVGGAALGALIALARRNGDR